MSLMMIVIVLVVLAVVGIGVLVTTQRVASEHKVSEHSDVDAETEAHLKHPPGGNTGGL